MEWKLIQLIMGRSVSIVESLLSCRRDKCILYLVAVGGEAATPQLSRQWAGAVEAGSAKFPTGQRKFATARWELVLARRKSPAGRRSFRWPSPG